MRDLTLNQELDLHREIGRIEGNALILKRLHKESKTVVAYAEDILLAVQTLKDGVLNCSPSVRSTPDVESSSLDSPQ